MMRTAYELRPDDDDWSQAGTLVRDVWDDAQRDRFVHTVSGHLLGGVTGDVLERAFQYWQNVDADTGKQIEELVRDGGGSGRPESMETGYVRDTKTFAAHPCRTAHDGSTHAHARDCPGVAPRVVVTQLSPPTKVLDQVGFDSSRAALHEVGTAASGSGAWARIDAIHVW